MQPQISIIMPCYNAESYVSEAIASIQSQTFQEWELLVIDDASTDNSQSVVENLVVNDSRIQLFKNEKNLGAGLSRNVGLDHARGRYLVFFDADDICYPTKLEKQIHYMQKEQYAFVFGGYDYVSPGGIKVGTFMPTVKRVDYNYLLTDCVVAIHTVMLDRQKIPVLPRFPNIHRRQDFVFWLELLRKYVQYGFLFPGSPLVAYRLREKSLSSNKLGALRSNFIVYRKFEKFSILKSSYILFRYCINYLRYRFWVRIKNKLQGYS